MEPEVWSNRNPGNLEDVLPEVARTAFGDPVVERAREAGYDWAALSLERRIEVLQQACIRIRDRSEELATWIARETGKPIREARLELGAVVGKFELAFEDGRRWLVGETPGGTPHPALVRRLARGPAAVIAPFNFPIHLGHGAAVAYLLGGSPVLFEPSPLAAVTAGVYGEIMRDTLPEGVFQLVQGWGDTGGELARHPGVRSVCFTGSVAAGRALAQALATDFSKDLALELGGKNAAIVRADADLDLAAAAVAEAVCLTTGQRCNATSRVLVHREVQTAFLDRLCAQIERFQPGDPLMETTLLGPLISEGAVSRFAEAIAWQGGDWIKQGAVVGEVAGLKGHYVTPAVVLARRADGLTGVALWHDEIFAPIVVLVAVATDSEAVAVHDTVPHGLTASIFTRNREAFEWFANRLRVGNVYANLPTTFSPSTLPFGGLRGSGNHRPGGRGFVRFTTDEQAVQWLDGAFGERR